MNIISFPRPIAHKMATGHDLINSVESQQIKLEYKLSEVYFMFKEFIECSNTM
jgi:hypothetical protein